MNKFRVWLIKKLVGNKPIIANVTIQGVTEIKATEPEVVFHRSLVYAHEGEEKRESSA